MKKNLSLLMIIVLCFSLLTACGGKVNEASDAEIQQEGSSESFLEANEGENISDKTEEGTSSPGDQTLDADSIAETKPTTDIVSETDPAAETDSLDDKPLSDDEIAQERFQTALKVYLQAKNSEDPYLSAMAIDMANYWPDRDHDIICELGLKTKDDKEFDFNLTPIVASVYYYNYINYNISTNIKGFIEEKTFDELIKYYLPDATELGEDFDINTPCYMFATFAEYLVQHNAEIKEIAENNGDINVNYTNGSYPAFYANIYIDGEKSDDFFAIFDRDLNFINTYASDDVWLNFFDFPDPE